MWFKVFVLLRVPISLVCLLGFAAIGSVGLLFALGACVFLAVASIKFVRREPGALSLAGWLLAFEVLGAVPQVAWGYYVATRHVDFSKLFAWACVVVVAWTLPNALAFYKARSLFVEPAKEKPGL